MQTNLHEQIKNTSINLLKTVTSSLDNGGAVTFQLQDVLEFIIQNNYTKEMEFLQHLLSQEKLTQESLNSFFKHMLFHTSTAQSFTKWQRKRLFNQKK